MMLSFDNDVHVRHMLTENNLLYATDTLGANALPKLRMPDLLPTSSLPISILYLLRDAVYFIQIASRIVRYT